MDSLILVLGLCVLSLLLLPVPSRSGRGWVQCWRGRGAFAKPGCLLQERELKSVQLFPHPKVIFFILLETLVPVTWGWKLKAANEDFVFL